MKSFIQRKVRKLSKTFRYKNLKAFHMLKKRDFEASWGDFGPPNEAGPIEPGPVGAMGEGHLGLCPGPTGKEGMV